jgi:hypothetical protein
MTNLPDDPIDAAEARFARRVRDYTDPAVVPVDHATIAAKAVGPGSGRPSNARPFGWLLAGAAAVAGVAAVVILAATLRGPNVGASPTAVPQPSAATGVVRCDASSDLRGQIVRWEGAAGSRIAEVTLTNAAARTCSIDAYQLALVDGAGRGQDLIVGTEISPGFTLEPGRQVTTLIQVSNYCLAYDPEEPVSIRMDGTSEDIVFEPAQDGSSGVPPCSGAGAPSTITQQPWR